MTGKIVIDVELCKGCGLCLSVCPKDNIIIATSSNSMGYFPAQSQEGACTGCALCALVCPDSAIEVFVDRSSSSDETKTNRSALAKDQA